MHLKEALPHFRGLLQKADIPSYHLDSAILLCYALKITREQLLFDDEFCLSETNFQEIHNLVNRRIRGEPISHLIGKREFFGNDFFVNSQVLDPRPDSETLIEASQKLIADHHKPLKILELGVGSGCLIITLLKIFTTSKAIGIDKQKEALEIAQRNALSLKVAERLELRYSNWFSAINADEKFDFIISNPPYIKSADIAKLQKEVKDYEPIQALDGGADGLDCYRQIANSAANFIKNNGYLLLEIGQGQEQEVREIFQNQLKFIRAERDLSGIIRILIFQKNENL